MLFDKIPEIKEVMVYGKSPEEDDKKRNDKELIITARVIPDMDELDKIKPNMTKDEIHQVIWEKIKEVNKKLSTYKAVKLLELKEGEFEKTSTMKIKRYKELQKDAKK